MRILPLVKKIRLLGTKAFWKTKVISALRGFFGRLFDVKPKHQKDYYPIARWLVSKRLAYAIVISLAILCLFYIGMTHPITPPGVPSGIPTYRYRAIPLKFHEGQVNILARDRHLAYTGMVSKGAANGEGTLFNKEGGTVYEGAFVENYFEGTGKQYDPAGTLRYQGEFSKNLYHGKGKAYAPNGVIAYDGEYQYGKRNGEGLLHNSVGNPIYQGTFRDDEIVYSALAGQPTDVIGEHYLGELSSFEGAAESCIRLDEIGVLAAINMPQGGTPEDWQADEIAVLKPTLSIGGTVYDSISALRTDLGEPNYQGKVTPNLLETLSLERLSAEGHPDVLPPTITATSPVKGTYQVTESTTEQELWIQSFVRDGFVYSVYTVAPGSDHFIFCLITAA